MLRVRVSDVQSVGDDECLRERRTANDCTHFPYLSCLPVAVPPACFVRVHPHANRQRGQILGKLSEKERKKRAKELLRLVGLQDRLAHLPSELSGGEQQRVYAAALTCCTGLDTDTATTSYFRR